MFCWLELRFGGWEAQRAAGLVGLMALMSSGWAGMGSSSLSPWLRLAKELGSPVSVRIKAWIYGRA